MNILFLRRSHGPGLERLNASGRACHLMRAIGHHIVRLACRSFTIMVRLADGAPNLQSGVEVSFDISKPASGEFVPTTAAAIINRNDSHVVWSYRRHGGIAVASNDEIDDGGWIYPLMRTQ